MLRYILTIFLSAFLLFQVQPMLGKFILPWFGGGPSVWSACLLFFQLLLLGGYLYAHGLSSRLKPRTQVCVHLGLLGVSLLFLPITPADSWKPTGTGAPALHILALLTVCVGAPYLLLSTTGPLLQRWFTWTHPGRTPYRLYAVSNIGSLLGLLSYPFAIEPRVWLHRQTFAWSLAYGVFVALCAWCAVKLWRVTPDEAKLDAEPDADTDEPRTRTTAGRRALWVALAACGSTLLLATTNQLTQDVAPAPFLWVLPLSLYLLTFILCFGRERLYDRRVWAPLLFASLAGVVLLLGRFSDAPWWVQVAGFSAVLTVCCMVCHGELVRLKPAARELTGFYLMVSLGGALGGVFVSLIAPGAFPDYWEFWLSLIATLALFCVCLFADKRVFVHRGWGRLGWVALVAGFFALDYYLGSDAQGRVADALATSRNFYGVLRVKEYGQGTADDARYLLHGRIKHTAQLQDRKRRNIPATYYGPHGGISLALNHHPCRAVGNGALHFGVQGLGGGALAAFGRTGDTIRFYEINFAVVALSGEYFFFRQDTPAKTELVMGDARLSMERELREGHSQQFDVLALDAFNGDAIPMHLLTREAVRMYWKHLKPDGILAVHISNQYLNLAPVVRAIAEASGKDALQVIEDNDTEHFVWYNRWVLVTSNQKFIRDPFVRKTVTPWPKGDTKRILWTDDYSNLLGVLD
ncbi:MAG: spermidine synthase [Armatimonadetes bacterium]|nr:spermidine synthase [Armatimonadota bacterium]